MRNYILVFLFFICQHSGFAKEGNSSLKPLFTYYMELGSQYHLNKVDLKGLSGNSQLLGVSNSPGLSANLGLHVKYRSKMTTDFSIGASTFRGALQFIQPSLSGFESLVIEHRNFQQYYFLFKFLVGRSFKLTSRNSLEAQLGFQAFTSLRNKSEQKSYFEPYIDENGDTSSQLTLIEDFRWGDARDNNQKGYYRNALLFFQLTYHLRLGFVTRFQNRRSLKIGVELNSGFHNSIYKYQNRHQVIALNPDRTYRDHAQYQELFRYFGLYAQVGLKKTRE